MPSKFNILYRGEPGEAAEELENESGASVDELRLALINVLKRVALLEEEAVKKRRFVENAKCICTASPEAREAMSQTSNSSWEVDSKGPFPLMAMLDHRCPKHGEKAQPGVWGRHKEKELLVTYDQWLALKEEP